MPDSVNDRSLRLLAQTSWGWGPEEMKDGGLLLVRSRALVVEECWLNVALVPH